MHDDPPMELEFAQGFYPRFEAGWRAVEIAGRSAMLATVVAALVGLLGGGPVKVWSRTVSAGDLAVTYQPIARFGTPSGLDVEASVPYGAREVALTVPDALAADFDLQSVTPRPTRWEAGAGSMRLVFAPQPGATRLVVHFGGMPPVEGWLRLSMQLDDQPSLGWSQFILP